MGTVISSFPPTIAIGQRGKISKDDHFDFAGWDQDPRGILWLWEAPDSHQRYVIGGDPTFGRTGWNRHARTEEDLSTDNGALVVIRRGKAGAPSVQVAEYAAPVDPFELAYIANIVGRVYGQGDEEHDGQAELIYEGFPGPGPSFTRQIMELGYGNLWRWSYFADLTVKPTQAVGWQATDRTNQQLWAKASRHLIKSGTVVRSPALAEEYSNLVVLPGKYWAASISARRHDDRVRAHCLALWAEQGWDVEFESTDEPVQTDATGDGPVEWAHTDMSADDIREAWNERFDAIMRSGEGTRRR
jgi:hypothetical protein